MVSETLRALRRLWSGTKFASGTPPTFSRRVFSPRFSLQRLLPSFHPLPPPLFRPLPPPLLRPMLPPPLFRPMLPPPLLRPMLPPPLFRPLPPPLLCPMLPPPLLLLPLPLLHPLRLLLLLLLWSIRLTSAKADFLRTI